MRATDWLSGGQRYSLLGIAVAERSGIFSVLVENFTWDWIYADYVSTDRRFEKHIDLLAEAGTAGRDQHVQASPVAQSHRRQGPHSAGIPSARH
ncbi:MAG: hypothetical protein R2860_00930 [Desulfobacterales bacterium]